MDDDHRMMTTEQSEDLTMEFGSLMEWMNGFIGGGDPETIEFSKYNGVHYMIRKVGSWYCAYIEVPIDIDTQNFKCPWGVTWGDYREGKRPSTEWPDGMVVADGLKVIGWDYNHCSLDSHSYTKEEVMEDIKICIDSLR